MRACVVCLTLAVCAAALSSVRADDVWWESAVIYQIYPRSFMDSDGDGIGDLNGITSKMQYFVDIGVDAIWMSPIYKSPMYDFGYDITDYTAIAEEYGTMADFDTLMATAKSLGIRVIMDYVPNHTSHESYWFQQSVLQNGSYTDYYIWADGKTDSDGNLSPPSNWISIFRKSAWEYNSVRGQYYLHQFVIQQPDLNYRSAAVRQEMQEVLRFWLDKGVSGFRVDAINMMYEVDKTNGTYPDEPLSGLAGYTSDDYEYLNHTYTKDLNETYEVVYDWRTVLDEYTAKTGESKVMMTEGYTDIDHMMLYYGNGVRNGSIPFNFIFLGEISSNSSASTIKSVIEQWMDNMPSGKVANWVNGNHDNSRMATRYTTDRVDAMNLLALILPGLTITYQGEELGMTDGSISWASTVDPQACNTDNPITYYTKSRDPERTPFHWDIGSNAGFSTANSTWLPMASNYRSVNVALQKSASKSHYKFYKDVVALKHTDPVTSGDLVTEAPSETVLVVTRTLDSDSVVGLINLSNETQVLNLTSYTNVPDTLTVVASGVTCTLTKTTEVSKDEITMPGHCALALTGNSAIRIASSSILIYCILYFFYTAV